MVSKEFEHKFRSYIQNKDMLKEAYSLATGCALSDIYIINDPDRFTMYLYYTPKFTLMEKAVTLRRKELKIVADN